MVDILCVIQIELKTWNVLKWCDLELCLWKRVNVIACKYIYIIYIYIWNHYLDPLYRIVLSFPGYWVLWTSLNQRPNSLTSGEVHMSWRWMSSTRGPAETLFWWPRPMDERIRLKSWQRWCCKATNRTEDIGLTSFISKCVRQFNPCENWNCGNFKLTLLNVPCTSGDSFPIMPWTFYKIYTYNAMYLNHILHYYTLLYISYLIY